MSRRRHDQQEADRSTIANPILGEQFTGFWDGITGRRVAKFTGLYYIGWLDGDYQRTHDPIELAHGVSA